MAIASFTITYRPNQSGIDAVLRSPEIARDLMRRGIRVQTQARRLCPVDTGRLRSSIGVRQEARGSLTPVTIIGTNVEYAIYVHDGTRYMAGRPFLRDALSAAG